MLKKPDLCIIKPVQQKPDERFAADGISGNVSARLPGFARLENDDEVPRYSILLGHRSGATLPE
jgi:hypothetical protein